MARRQSMCRHCYSYGHTKRTCPTLKQFIKDNPTSYLAEDIKRKCSYCRTAGHTRAKCPDFAERKRQKRIEVLENRQSLCNALIDLGIAPGALVKAEFYIPHNRGFYLLPAIVNKVRWSNITKTHDDALEVILPEYNIVSNVRIPKHRLLRDVYSETLVIAPMSHEAAKRYNETEMEKYNESVIKKVQ
jgi:hypothetical protein